MPLSRRSRAREVALQLLFQVECNPHVTRTVLQQFAEDRLKHPDLVRFALQLFDGTAAQREIIDKNLADVAENWRLVRMAAVDRNVLRLGAYELLFASDTPPSVVLNEAIELARRFGSQHSPSFVNGVLDKVHRSTPGAIEENSPAPAGSTL